MDNVFGKKHLVRKMFSLDSAILFAVTSGKSGTNVKVQNRFDDFIFI